MASDPAGRDDVVQMASPLPSTATPVHPAMALPFWVKSTVPTGVPPPGETGATAAVKATDCPKGDVERGTADRVVVVAAGFTVYASVPLLVMKFPPVGL